MSISHETLNVDLDERDGRYHRQELISWWRQERLAEARVLVVGAGALGNELVKNLALLGVGTVLVADLDVVENSNLARCVLFREHDEGSPKAEVVASAAAALNPDVRVIPVVGDVCTSLGLGAYRDLDVVVGGLDNREARVHVNQACWKATVPWVDGAIEGLLGVMRVFVPPHSACYECTMNRQDHKLLAMRRACSLLTRDQMLAGKVPTTVTSASVIAALQVQEVVKLLHRDELEYSFAGRGFVFNGLTHDSYVVTYPRREDCLSHDSYDGPWEPIPEGTSLGGVLARAQAELGAEAVLDFEHDIVVSATCAHCESRVDVRRPLASVSIADATCGTCGRERALELTHSVSADDHPLLGLTPDRLGLPPSDVLTARCGEQRRFYRIGERRPLEVLEDAAV